ncbi:MAG: sialidase family protein [Candidatus Promineifilaceae bacterium]
MARRLLIAPLILLGILLLSLIQVRPSAGQTLEKNWTSPYRLSSQDKSSSQPYILSDKYGYVHLFWVETGGDGERATINYTNFNGQTWASPVDIYAAPIDSPILYMSPTIDDNGTLYLAWTEGESGPAYMSTAPAFNALSAQNWQSPVRLDIPSFLFELRVDSAGFFHVFYALPGSAGSGLYYKRSEDRGASWVDLQRIDPDTPSNLNANVIKFILDDNNGLHATWTYVDLNITAGAAGTWVRYAHSLDGGKSWAFPVSIDESDESADELRMAYPAMTVNGDIINIVWTGDSAVHREYSYSADRGETWSVNKRIFGDLQGQARGDGLALDSLGRTHFIGNIRWPTGLYYSMWDEDQWTPPLLVYLIRENSDTDPGDRISAHDIRMAVRSGNQIVVAFADAPDAPKRGLFVIQETLPDAPVLASEPIPTATVQPTPVPTATSVPPTPTPLPLPEQISKQPILADPQTPGRTLVLGLVPILALLGISLVFRLILQRR